MDRIARSEIVRMSFIHGDRELLHKNARHESGNIRFSLGGRGGRKIGKIWSL